VDVELPVSARPAGAWWRIARGCVGLVNPYNAAASGLRQRVSLADFAGCSLPRFGSIATFRSRPAGGGSGSVRRRGPRRV